MRGVLLDQDNIACSNRLPRSLSQKGPYLATTNSVIPGVLIPIARVALANRAIFNYGISSNLPYTDPAE